MSRTLRIEYPGAWYHIMNRGGRYEAIFEDKFDYSAIYKKRKLPAMLGSETFLKLIKDHYFIKKKLIGNLPP